MVRAGTRRHVVVQLEERDAELADKPLQRAVQVVPRSGVPQIEEYRSCSRTRRPCRCRNASDGNVAATGLWTPMTSGSSHKPTRIPAAWIARVTPARPSPGRAAPGGLPGAHARPPVAARGVVVPAGVDAEAFGACTRGCVDERQETAGGRIAVERVHVVVEHQRPSSVRARRSHLSWPAAALADGNVTAAAYGVSTGGSGGVTWAGSAACTARSSLDRGTHRRPP